MSITMEYPPPRQEMSYPSYSHQPQYSGNNRRCPNCGRELVYKVTEESAVCACPVCGFSGKTYFERPMMNEYHHNSSLRFGLIMGVAGVITVAFIVAVVLFF